MTSTLKQYQDRLAKMPADAFIGEITWFTVAGSSKYQPDGTRSYEAVRVPFEQMEEWFEELDLDQRFLPPRPRKVDAFRRSTSEVKREWEVTEKTEWVATCSKCKVDYTFGENKPQDSYECRDDGTKLKPQQHTTPMEGVSAELMVREVTFNEELVVRHVVKEMRDRKGQKLSYQPHLATLKFYRGDKKMRGKKNSGEKWKPTILPSVTGTDREQVQSLIDEVQERYVAYADLHADAIRAVIRNYLVSLNAIAVKANGGVYFVHNTRLEILNRLGQLVDKFGPGCSLHQLPLIDTPRQREMLTSSFQDEIEDDVRVLLKDLAKMNERVERNNGGKVTPEKYAEFAGRYEALVERSEEYTKLLGLAQGRSASALEMALDSITDMVDRLDVPKRAAS